LPRKLHFNMLFTDKQRTQQLNSAGPLSWTKFFLIILTQCCWRQVKSQICDTQITTWQTLIDAIEEPYNHGIVFLCPFIISGDECPIDERGYQVKENDHIQLLCEPSDMGHSECTIDCPGIHFEILPRGALVLDGVTLRGSENSAVRIQSNGSLMTINSVFEDNINSFGNGAAINAFKDSEIIIEYTRFKNNEGLSGGAIYLQGNAFMKGSIFLDNKAIGAGGGAIYVGANGKTSLTENMFAGNSALLFGPAVFDAEGGVTVKGENSGCGNNGSINCSGVSALINGTEQCDNFILDCIAPTSSPTTFPSESPIILSSKPPSTTPSLSPSRAVYFFPSITPDSMSPTRKSSTRFSRTPISPNPSSRPSLSPVKLSSAPSLYPSQSPTLSSTHASKEPISYCTWGSCDGIVESSYWCNQGRERCVNSCGGTWCVE